MASESLKERVAALEAEVARLKQKLEGMSKTTDPWMEHVWGAFANDPAFEEAMRLGREWRESFRPKPRKNRKTTHARAEHETPKSAGKGGK